MIAGRRAARSSGSNGSAMQRDGGGDTAALAAGRASGPDETTLLATWRTSWPAAGRNKPASRRAEQTVEAGRTARAERARELAAPGRRVNASGRAPGVDARGDVGGEADFGKPQERRPSGLGALAHPSRSSDRLVARQGVLPARTGWTLSCLRRSDSGDGVRVQGGCPWTCRAGMEPLDTVVRHGCQGGKRERPTTRTSAWQW